MAKYYKYRVIGKIKREPKKGYYIDKNGYIRAFTLKQYRKQYFPYKKRK